MCKSTLFAAKLNRKLLDMYLLKELLRSGRNVVWTVDHIIVSSITLHLLSDQKRFDLLEFVVQLLKYLYFLTNYRSWTIPSTLTCLKSIFSYKLGRIYLVFRVFSLKLVSNKNRDNSKDILNLLLQFILLAWHSISVLR